MRLRRLAARGTLPCLIVILGVLASGYRFSISVPTSVGTQVVPFSDAAWAIAAEPTKVSVLEPGHQMRGVSLQTSFGQATSWPSRFALAFEDHGPVTELGLLIAHPPDAPRAPPPSLP
jgi:hypothetical protein